MSGRVDAILLTLQGKLTAQELDDLAQALTEEGNVEVRPAGDWSVLVGGKNLARGKEEMDKVAFEHREDTDAEDVDIEVKVWHGHDDGVPVIQIDGSHRFRVNVNDLAIWDADPDKHKHKACACVKEGD